LAVAAATTINITGDAGLIFGTGETGEDITKVTTLDASGMSIAKETYAGVTYTATFNTIGNATTVKGSNGKDVISTGVSNDTVDLGAGADSFKYLGGKDTVTGGSGVNTYDIDDDGTKANHLVITDLKSKDKIDVGDVTSTNVTTALGAATTLSAGSEETLDNYLAAAFAADASSATQAVHFQFGGNTYLGINNTDGGSGAGFGTGDALVEITGLVTLKGATVSGEVFTIL